MRGFEIAGSKKSLSQASGKFLDAMGVVNALPFGYSIDMTLGSPFFPLDCSNLAFVWTHPRKQVDDTTHNIENGFHGVRFKTNYMQKCTCKNVENVI